jgi:Protein of unknown function (DUF5818)
MKDVGRSLNLDKRRSSIVEISKKSRRAAMRKISLSVCLAFAFFVASAVAQMGGSQGTQSSSPSAQQPGQSQQPGMGQGTSNDQNTTQNQNNGEHTLKGCVQSQGGSYVLETKKGKDIALSGQDISAHVGHEVAVKGTWEGGAMSSTSSSSAGSAEKTFNVASVKHISDTCKAKSSSGNAGSTGSTGNASPSSTAPASQSPQTNQPPQQ